MSITRPKWTYRLGIYRCDRGWDSAGESFECRRSGICEVGTEWLCPFHALTEKARHLSRIEVPRRVRVLCAFGVAGSMLALMAGGGIVPVLVIAGLTITTASCLKRRRDPAANLCLRCDVNRCPGTWCASCNEIIEAEGERRSEAVTWRQWWRGYPTIEG